MSIQDEIKQSQIVSASSLSFRTITPKQYGDRQHEFYSDITRTFIENNARYSINYVEAKVQGLDPNDPFGYTDVHLRLADVVSNTALTSTADDHKRIQLAERQYGYLRKGAKVITMGSVWLIDDPRNLSDGGTAVIRRCDTTWNYYDYYGNLCKEPMCVNLDLMRASTPDPQRSTMITKGYFPAMVQYNPQTKDLFHNTRIILGSSAYMLTGFSDFQSEFTFEDDAISLMEFALRYDTPNDALDDMENRVANGKTFSWDVNVSGTSQLTAGETYHFTATSVRTTANGAEEVFTTEEHPISYLWTSSDESVATVDEHGDVTAVGQGEVVITATLEQNTDKKQDFALSVVSVSAEPHVAFLQTYPESVPMFGSVTFEAAYFENGVKTDEPLTWTVSGADKDCYSLDIHETLMTLKCWGGSVEPAVITATHGSYSATVQIYLEGI